MVALRAAGLGIATALAACSPFAEGSTSDAGASARPDASAAASGKVRRELTITNAASVPLPAEHVVCTSFTTTNARADLGDVRLLGPSGERERFVEPRPGGSIAVCGRLERPIAPGASDDGYAIVYGDPNASPPAHDPAHVFMLYDGFDGASLAPRWTSVGSPRVTDGALVLPAGGESAVHTADGGVDGDVVLEMRVRVTMPASATTAKSGLRFWFGFQSSLDPQAPWSLFISRQPSLVRAEHLLTNSCSDGCESAERPLDGELHEYRIERKVTAPGGARFAIDDALVFTGSTTTPRQGIIVRSYLATSDVLVDWVRARPLVSPEPVVTVGAEEAR